MKRTIEFNAHEVALLAQALDLEHEIYYRLSVYEGDRLKQKALLRKLKKWLRMENKRLLDECFNELKEELGMNNERHVLMERFLKNLKQGFASATMDPFVDIADFLFAMRDEQVELGQRLQKVEEHLLARSVDK